MSTVAIITRTKNRTLLLSRAVESVLNQTHQDWTHVIVNDGGDSKAVDALLHNYKLQYQNRLLILHNKVSLGMEAASNKGIHSSNSKYITIHDDDDSWDPKFLKTCIDELENNQFPQIQGVITHTTTIHETVDEKSVKFLYSHPFDPYLSSITIPQMSEVNRFMPISFLFTRKAWEDAGKFDESLPVIGDWEFNLRFLYKYDIKIIKLPLANYHIRDNKTPEKYQNTVTAGKDQHEFYRSIIINKHIRDYLNESPLGKAQLLLLGDYFHRMNGGIYRLNTIIDRLKNSLLVKVIRRLISK